LVEDRVEVKEVWAGVSVEAEVPGVSGPICRQVTASALIAV